MRHAFNIDLHGENDERERDSCGADQRRSRAAKEVSERGQALFVAEISSGHAMQERQRQNACKHGRQQDKRCELQSMTQAPVVESDLGLIKTQRTRCVSSLKSST